MFALIVAVLFLALALLAVRAMAACPLLRTLAISANCWAEGEQRRREAA